MMRSWPLESFVKVNGNSRPSSPWNHPILDVCQDCGHKATLWVETSEIHHDFHVLGFRVNKFYGKLCEPCYALRILGDNEKTE